MALPEDVDTDLLRAALDERRPRLPVEAVLGSIVCLASGAVDLVRAALGARMPPGGYWINGSCVFVGAFVLAFTLIRHRRHKQLWSRGVESLERLERMKMGAAR